MVEIQWGRINAWRNFDIMDKKSFKKVLGKIDLYALIGVLVGVVLLGQPFSKFLFIVAFPMILICTVTHMVLDHLI